LKSLEGSRDRFAGFLSLLFGARHGVDRGVDRDPKRVSDRLGRGP